MKKIFILLLTIGFLANVAAQKRAPGIEELKKVSLTRHYQAPTDITPPGTNNNLIADPKFKDTRLGDETEIIETVYDLQTNSSLSNRFWMWESGSMAAVATRGMTAPNYTDRGTGYNFGHVDGIYVNWQPKPTARIESLRTGWPSIAPWGENGEIIVSHNFPTQLVILQRDWKGTGTWVESLYAGPGGGVAPSWPRMVTSGENFNYLNLVYNTNSVYQGQPTAMLYSRYSKDTQTWDIQDVQLEGTGSDYYTEIRADDYTMAAKGNVVVILLASPWSDLFMLKSTDNGETFEKTMIWEHPYPFFDFNTTLMPDTLYAVDNSASLAIDDNGMVHVVWGVGRVARLAAAPPDPGFYSYWPYTDGIGYWNENMGQIPEADNPHHTMMPEYLESLGMLIGWTQDVNNSGFVFDYEGTAETPFNVYRSLGISTMPTIAINDNNIIVAFASATETFVTADGTMNYKHIWTRNSYDLGQTWGDFLDLQNGNIFHLYDECIYPQFAQNTDNYDAFNLIYNADNLPGLTIDEDHDPVINRIIHNRMWWLVGIEDQGNTTPAMKVSQNYPNPASNRTLINFELSKTTDVTLEIFNSTGQQVAAQKFQSLQPGIHAKEINISGMTPGVYFYTLAADKERITQKMIVK